MFAQLQKDERVRRSVKNINTYNKLNPKVKRWGGNRECTQVAQLLAVGMVPQNPNIWRHHTTENTAGGTGGGWGFTQAQRNAIHNNNIANAGGNRPVLAAGNGNYPISDSTNNALITGAEANLHAPQVDHIVEAAHWGANDLENARLISQGENNGNIALGLGRPTRTDQRMRAYQQITIAANGGGAPAYVNNAAGVINAGDNLTLDQIKALSRYAGQAVPNNYAGVTDAMIAGIGGAANGINANVNVT